ncbi:cyclase family protein [Candidatus Dependentiae bacterium]|nr:cyclase family protein [Candidatus Dependentiae bacterium]
MKYTNLIDISWPISPTMTAYKDKKVVSFTATKQFETDQVRETHVLIGTHTGTHIDAPAHFLATGETIDKQSLSRLIGACRVIDLTHCVEKITASDLALHNLKPGERILCKTRNSLRSSEDLFNPLFIFIDHSASIFCVEQKISAIGVDYLGIERSQPGHETHTTLLGAGIALIEGLRLAHVQPGVYGLICLPLLLDGLDGSPARAILLEHSS